MADQPKVVVIDSPNTPDVFASWCHGMSRRQGNVHITLTADRWSHTDKEARLVVIGRLVMPIEGVVDMVRGLQDFLKNIGVDINNPPPSTEPKPTLQ